MALVKKYDLLGIYTYRILLSVLSRIHWGMGLFCFWAFASFFLIMNRFREPMAYTQLVVLAWE